MYRVYYKCAVVITFRIQKKKKELGKKCIFILLIDTNKMRIYICFQQGRL